MIRSYQRVTRAAGCTAAGGTALYVLFLLLAASDGPDGIEGRIELTGLVLVAISLLGFVASVGWLIDHANRVNAERIAASIAATVVKELDPRIHRATKRAGSRTVKLLNESITGELMTERLNEAINRAVRLGQIAGTGRDAHGEVSNGQPWTTHPGGEQANGSVSSMRRR